MVFQENSGSDFQFVGNYLCLDFLNTRVLRAGRPVDLLRGPADLARWFVEAGIAGPEQVEATPDGEESDLRGRGLFERALEFREVLLGVVEAVIVGGPVRQEALDEINAVLRARPKYRQVERTPEGFGSRFESQRGGPVAALAPIAESAADLLVEGDLSLLKKCENPRCVLHFYDTSKNHARRWCSMSGCGNRMKAQAHYRRRRGARP